MGSISSYETSDGRRYKVRYRDPDRRSREKNGFTRKRDAEDYLANITVAALRGEYVDPKTAKSTVGELGTEWLANQTQLKPSTYRGIESAWRVHVEPTWGNRRIGDIRFSEVQGWLTRFGAGEGKARSATVVIRAYGVLAAILDVAVRDRRISSNPARGVKLPRKGKKQRVYLTAAQVELLAGNSGNNGTLVLTLAYTGIRWGEAIGVRVQSLDALRRRMLIQENAVTIGSKVVVGTPKTHENRSVPYPEFLAEPLARACEGKSRDQLVFGDGLAHLARAGSGQGWFWNAVKASQAVDPLFPDITPHDLRHTAASLAISAGANPKAVQRMLGHASAAMTLDTYADLFEDDLDAVSERLNAVRAATVVGFSWGAGVNVRQLAP
ncbi:MAG TPA: tyrosine-type recombinase/integrase [Galbitalea sp.]